MHLDKYWAHFFLSLDLLAIVIKITSYAHPSSEGTASRASAA